MKTTTKTIRRVDQRWLMTEVGKRLRVAREKRGMTLHQAALHFGVTRAAVNNWELANQAGMMLANIYDASLIYDVPIKELLP